MGLGKLSLSSLPHFHPFCLCLPVASGHFNNLTNTCLFSRVALKKYIQANNNGVGTGPTFDSQFNRAVKAGVEQGIFAQPKGMSHHGLLAIIIVYLRRHIPFPSCPYLRPEQSLLHPVPRRFFGFALLSPGPFSFLNPLGGTPWTSS